MAFLPCSKFIHAAAKCYTKSCANLTVSVRNLVSKQLVYGEFGDPLQVVKFRESEIPPLGAQDVLVRMLAAPINPADINTIQGKYPVKVHLPCIPGNEGVGVVEEIGDEVDGVRPGNKVIVTKPIQGKNACLPRLPSVPGGEGVGVIVEVGEHVTTANPGDRVVLSSRLLGSWRYYGVYNEKDVHVISKNLPIPEAAMLTIAPCTAYRMLKDFKEMSAGETVIQNAANSACGQSVIQLCRAWGINTFNIVANHCGYEAVKAYLLSLGATAVFTLEEAEELTSFDTSLSRPTLALNCLGGRYEDVMLKLLERNGVIVYYGSAYNLPMSKQFLRCDAEFHKFHLANWESQATSVEKDIMYKAIVQLILLRQFKAPVHQTVEMKDYMLALKNTVHCDAFSTRNYVFDFTSE